jgi:beta-mannanase
MRHDFAHTPPQSLYIRQRRYERAMSRLVSIMSAGASAECVALFVRRQHCGTQMRLSWAIENVSYDGTFAFAVFDILCNG